MLDPNSFAIARLMHEQRVAEAVRKQQHRLLPAPGVGLLTRLSLGLGNYLICIGAKLKTLAPVSPPAYDPHAGRVGR